MLKPTLVDGDMHYWRVQPDERLRSHVLCYYIVRATPDSKPGQPDALRSELLLPDGHSELVFSFGAAFERWVVGEQKRSIMRPSYVIGGRSQSVLTRNLGNLDLVGVKLDSRALRKLTQVPLHEFRDATLTLAELNDRPLLDLEDALSQTRRACDVVRTLDRFFLKAFADGPREAPTVDALLHDIHRNRGALSIMEWIRRQRVDARSLERRFSGWTGMTPKRYARVIRFKHSYHRLISGEGAAGEHLDGYYDQSHFNREFRYFMGAAPSERLRGRMRLGTTVTDHLIDGELAHQS